jgi:hypothetical protein
MALFTGPPVIALMDPSQEKDLMRRQSLATAALENF